MHRTCVVLVNWNCWALTRTCLEAVARQTRRPALTVVVDNASDQPGGAELLDLAREHFRRPASVRAGQALASGTDFALLEAGDNLGWSGGNNAAVALAAGHGITAFWFLNPDTVAEPDCLERLEDHLDEHPEVGLVGATVLGAQDALECAAGCRYLGLATVVRPAHAGLAADRVLAAAEPRLDYVLGACLFARARMLEDVGAFNPACFLYYGEVDLGLRARRAGWSLGWCRAAVVRHRGGGCLAQALPQERERRLLANYHENLGALEHAWQANRLAFPLALAFRTLGKLAVLAWRGEWHLARALGWALWDFAAGRRLTSPGRGPCPGPRCGPWRGR